MLLFQVPEKAPIAAVTMKHSRSALLLLLVQLPALLLDATSAHADHGHDPQPHLGDSLEQQLAEFLGGLADSVQRQEARLVATEQQQATQAQALQQVLHALQKLGEAQLQVLNNVNAGIAWKLGLQEDADIPSGIIRKDKEKKQDEFIGLGILFAFLGFFAIMGLSLCLCG